MRKLLWFIIIDLALVLGVIAAFNLGAFHPLIERRLAESTGAKVELGRMTLGLPLSLTIARTRLVQNAGVIEWERLRVELGSVFAPIDLRVTLVKPRIQFAGALADAGKAPSSSDTAPAADAKPLPALRLTLKIEGGEFSAKDLQLSELNLAFSQKLLLKTPAALHAAAVVKGSLLPVPALPFTLDTDALNFSADGVKAQGLKATVAGLFADVQGASLLKEGRHRWLLQIQAPDLAKVPPPPGAAASAAKNWKGSVQVKAEVVKDGVEAPWRAEGDLRAKDVAAELNLVQQSLKARGPFNLDLTGKFVYDGTAILVPAVAGRVDFTRAAVGFGEFFEKPAGTALELQLDGVGEGQRVQLKALTLRLAQLQAKLSGSTGVSAPWFADLALAVDPVPLSGLELIFPPLRRSPLQGEFSGRAAINGPLSDPLNARLVLEGIRLKDFSAQIDYEKPDKTSLRGRVRADVTAQAELNKGDLIAAKGQGRVDLRDLALSLGPLRKGEKQEMAAEFALSSTGRDLLIERFDLKSFVGRLGLKGAVGNPLKPRFNLTVSAAPLDLAGLRQGLPALSEKIADGEVLASLKVAGSPETAKPWNDWPIDLSGEVKLTLPEYKFAPAPAPPAVSKSPPQPAPSEPLLPTGHLISRANLKIDVRIQSVVKEKTQLQSVGLHGALAYGRFRGDAAVGRVFGGDARAHGLNIPLLEKRPLIQGSLSWNNLIIEEAMAFAKPEYKEFAAGRTSGHADFATLMPSETDFLRALKARGDLGAAPVTLNSVKLGDLINEQLKKAPLLNIPPVKVDPLRGELSARFDLAAETMQISPLQARDKDGSELQLKGKVVLSTLQADMVGSFFWMQNQIKGCVLAGNADDKGRLIVPLAIKGDLLHPGFSVLSDTVGKLAARALECEKNKLVDKVKKEGADALKKELDKTLKGLFGN